MIPKHTENKQDQKTELCPINKSGGGVAQQKFSWNGVAFMDIIMRWVDEQEFSKNYNPILLIKNIKTLTLK